MLKITSALLALLFLYGLAEGQDVEVRIKVDDATPNMASVEGRYTTPRGVPNLSFMSSYAGVNNLVYRVSEVKLADADKKDVEFKKLQAGEYLGERNYTFFAYTLNLTPMPNAAASAHVSWLTPDGGMIALDDILPQPTDKQRVKLTLDLPRGWRIVTNEDKPYENIVDVHDAQRAVLFVGKNWRLKPAGSTRVTLTQSGEWQFTDEWAAGEVQGIYKAYKDRFGGDPVGSASVIALARFPKEVSTGNWEAETRGSIVTMLSSGGFNPNDAGRRFDQQLRHEIFHLWVPSGVNLKGSYDWFYEGFAVYQEQKLAVMTNQVRFQDFINTLGRAFDIDRLSIQRKSMVEISQTRWAGSNMQLYARGMLIAFLTDVAMLDASKGKKSVETLLRQLLEMHRPPAQPVDANAAVISLMRSYPELNPIVDRYIAGADTVDWLSFLDKAGIQSSPDGQLTSLAAVANPNGRQKVILDKLGYNNWRKLAQ